MYNPHVPSQERSIRVEAVILRHKDYAEADRILTILTAELGKLNAIAKGVRKLGSRKAGHLEPFTHTSLLLARGHDLFIVTQAETLDYYPHLRESLPLFGYGTYALELLDRFTYEEGENLPLFRLLRDTLNRLDTNDDAPFVLRFYELRLLDLLGFRPQLFQCVSCHAKVKPESQYFSCELGGVLCPRCGTESPTAIPASMQALKFMRHIQRSSYREARIAKIPPDVMREMEMLLQRYLTHLLERKLNTPAFLRQVL